VALSSPGAANDDFWGAYNTAHTYEYEVLGSGSRVYFYVKDIHLEDNFGTYTVNFYRQAYPVASVPAPLPVFGAAAAQCFAWPPATGGVAVCAGVLTTKVVISELG
jgi:hypothetical protein